MLQTYNTNEPQYKGVRGLARLRRIAKRLHPPLKVNSNRGNADFWKKMVNKYKPPVYNIQLNVSAAILNVDGRYQQVARQTSTIRSTQDGEPLITIANNGNNFKADRSAGEKDSIPLISMATVSFLTNNKAVNINELATTILRQQTTWQSRTGAFVAPGLFRETTDAGYRSLSGSIQTLVITNVELIQRTRMVDTDIFANHRLGEMVLKYPNMKDISQAEPELTCVYSLLKSEHNISPEQAHEAINSKPDKLSATELAIILRAHKRPFILVDLTYNTIKKYNGAEHRDNHKHYKVAVYACGSNHVYKTTEALRAKILNKEADHAGRVRPKKPKTDDDEQVDATIVEISEDIPTTDTHDVKLVIVPKDKTAELNEKLVELLSMGQCPGIVMKGDTVSTLEHNGTRIQCTDNAEQVVRIAQVLGWESSGGSICAFAERLMNTYGLMKRDEMGRLEAAPTYYNEELERFISDNIIRHPLMTGGEAIDLSDEGVRAVDFRRHYTSIMLLGDLYRIKDAARFKRVTMNHKLGRDYMYYLDGLTAKNSLVDKSGIYCWDIVKYALNEGLIRRVNIVGCIEVIRVPALDVVMREAAIRAYYRCTDGDAKQLVNAMIGHLTKTSVRNNNMRTLVTMSKPEAIERRMKNVEMTEFRTIKLNQEHPFGAEHKQAYVVSQTKRTIMEGSHFIAGMVIRQRAKLKTYKLAIEIQDNGGIIQGINTDSIQYRQVAPKTRAEKGGVARLNKMYKRAGNKRIKDQFGAIRQETPKESYEVKSPLQYNKMTDEDAAMSELCLSIKKYPFEKETEWSQRAIKGEAKPKDIYGIDMDIKRAMITAPGGFGKSHLLKRMVKELREAGYDVWVASFMNIAARHIGGITIHKLLKNRRELGRKPVLLLDEVSMIPTYLWVAITSLGEDIPIYGFGDYRQLPAVEERAENVMNMEIVKKMFRGNLTILTKSYRSGDKYSKQCIEMYEGARSLPSGVNTNTPETYHPSAVNIAWTNRKVRDINNRILMEHPKARLRTPSERCKYSRVTRTENSETIRYHSERIDAAALQYILDNREKFAHFQKKRVSTKRKDYDVFEHAKEYLDRAVDGVVSTEWHRGKHGCIGRWYARESMSLINITRPIRHAIAHDLYTDIDLVNAHPKILRGLAKKWDVQTPMLDQYIEAREETLKTVMEFAKVDRDDAKQIILATINGGSHLAKYNNEFGKKWTAEMDSIRSAAMDNNPQLTEEVRIKRERQNRAFNTGGGVISILMGEQENRALQTLMKTMYEYKYATEKDIVMCYDGVMIGKVDENDPKFKKVIKEAQKRVSEKCGIEMELKVKPLKKCDLIPEDIPRHISVRDPYECLDYYPAVFPNMRVIMVESWKTLCNSQRLTYISGDENSVMLKTLEGGMINMPAGVFYNSTRPAHAMTVHKVQGMTIERPLLLWEVPKIQKGCRIARELLYTALTRARKAERVFIVSC